MRDKKTNKKDLAYYSYKGDVKNVKKLIAKGANIHRKNNKGWSALHVASRQGHSEIVKLLLDGKNENKADVDDRTKVSDTALHFASYHCHKDTVKVLLDAGANKEVRNDLGSSPLHWLAESSHGSDPSRLDDVTGIIDLLTNDSEDINPKDSFGNTPLFFAVEHGNKLTAQLLLDKGADVNETNEVGRRLSTYIKTQSMDRIIHTGVEAYSNGMSFTISEDTSSDESEVSLCSSKDKIEHDLFQLLNYPKNQDPNAAVNDETEIDYDPGTGLNEADVSSDEEEEIIYNPDNISEHKEEESVDSVKHLNVQNNLSHYAFEGNIEKVKQLIAQGANIHEKDDRGLSALHVASRQGHSEIVELLLDRRNENKADVDDRTCNSNTALHLASYHCHKDTVKVLVDAGAHRDVKNDYGSCPLHFIAESSHGSDPSRSEDIIGIIELLAFNSNVINLKDDCGNTPLHYAVKNGNKLTAQLLLEKGADPNVTNERGGRPLTNIKTRRLRHYEKNVCDPEKLPNGMDLDEAENSSKKKFILKPEEIRIEAHDKECEVTHDRNEEKVAYGPSCPYSRDIKMVGYRTIYDDLIFCFTFWCGGPSPELLAFLLFVEFASYVLWYLRTSIVL